jgi:hypothetical protein
MLELLGPAMSITTAALLAQSSLRSWRAENKFLKWGGTVLSALFSGAVSLISVIMLVGLIKLHARSAPVSELKVAGTLTGGLDLAQDLPVPIGLFVASNLTPAGQLSRWSDGDIFRAIRNRCAP